PVPFAEHLQERALGVGQAARSSCKLRLLRISASSLRTEEVVEVGLREARLRAKRARMDRYRQRQRGEGSVQARDEGAAPVAREQRLRRRELPTIQPAAVKREGAAAQ